MTTSIQTFNFAAGEQLYGVRVVNRDDGPWFVAADVCAALGIGRTDDGVSRLDDDEKGAGSIRTPGGEQVMTIINEAGLFSLILGSRKPEAKPFKRWITHEVLPAIARTGVYMDATNRMGETLSGATAAAIELERPATVGDAHSLFAAVAALHEAVRDNTQATVKAMQTIAEDRRAFERRERDLRSVFSREIGRIARISNARKPNNRNADPNRPLSDDDVERFKYLISVGCTAKEIARRLNRTYSVIHRFIETNQDMVIRALSHTLT